MFLALFVLCHSGIGLILQIGLDGLARQVITMSILITAKKQEPL